MLKLQNKVALITGAADGIGAAVAELFATEGATVVVTDIDLDGAQALAERLGGNATALHLDVCQEQEWRSVMDDVLKRFGRLDVLVNNAGGSGSGTIESTSFEDFQHIMRLNSDSVFIGCKLAVEAMKEKGGSIINVSSIHGIKAASYATGYSAAKGAVRLLTKAVALHCGENGYRVRCNSVHPGYILTTQMKNWVARQENSSEVMKGLIGKHPIGFLGEPMDVANGILYLASEDSRFVTASELVIDGGFSA